MDHADVDVRPATADRWADVATMLDPKGRGNTCWCLSWRLPPSSDPRNRQEIMHDLTADDPAPGLLAYLDDTVVGWIGLAPKSHSRTLQRSRVLPRGDPESWPTTWAVMCFLVRVGYRRRGVAQQLLTAAVPYAGQHGATVIEGYPVDSGGGRVPVSAAFVGTTDLFESAGFRILEPTESTSGRLPRWVARLDLTA